MEKLAKNFAVIDKIILYLQSKKGIIFFDICILNT
jgi:hypothetical protein